MASHVFGPVPSRRLGRSLGVDLVPLKTCTYDCLYCQLGPTPRTTVERKAWVPIDEVLAELEVKLDTRPDYVTLSGSGEPTLHSEVGDLIDRIKAATDIPVAVLTNGSLLCEPEVREAMAGADLVIPSLDAGDAETFRRVNRPDPVIDFDRMVEGLVTFGGEFTGEVWVEVVLLAGITDTPDAVDRIAAVARRVAPDRIQLNTVTRPPADAEARPVAAGRLAELATRFEPAAEVVADTRKIHQRREFQARRDDVLETLRRRPCTVEDVADGLGVHVNEVIKHVESLAAAGKVRPERVGERVYYRADEREPEGTEGGTR